MVDDNMEETADVLPYEYQVGGHSKSDGLPASLKDAQGRFLKRLQAGERGDREVAFYAAVEQDRQSTAAGPPGSNVMQELAKWIPKSYGTRHVCGADYLVLEDVTAGYSQPCILDVKIGYRTWYPWANQSLQAKYREKDAATSQSALGFRVCGVLVHNSATGSVWRADRHWGKTLTPDTVQQALIRFADNGHISLSGLLVGPGMLLEQLQSLADLASRQDQWHMFSTSLLVVYEGAAQSPHELRLVTRLIDFAHAFPTYPGSSAGAVQDAALSPVGVDDNFVSGLQSLICTFRHMLAQQQQQQQQR